MNDEGNGLTDPLTGNVWIPKDTNYQKWVNFYAQSLENNNKVKLRIWPNHCLIGSAGHAIYQPIQDALEAWSKAKNKNINYVTKGLNPLTDMYSAIKAEVGNST